VDIQNLGAHPLQTVAVIGAGPAGRAFAFRCAHAGFQVVLEDVMPSNLRRAQDEYDGLTESDEAIKRLRYASTVEDAVQDADLAIDFVPDELESKLEIFSLLDRMAPPRTVLCTPTRALSITDLASCTYRPTQCVALKADNGQLLSLPLEVVRSRFADATLIQRMGAFLTALGLTWSAIEDTDAPMLVKNLQHSA
jgi:3-hydroxybutyryl-CoA dehydrogenase